MKILPGEKLRWYRDAIFKPIVVGTVTALALRQWVFMPQDRAAMTVVLAGITLLVMAAVFWSVPTSRAFLRTQLKSLRGSVFNG
jgi:hypothetical protein